MANPAGAVSAWPGSCNPGCAAGRRSGKDAWGGARWTRDPSTMSRSGWQPPPRGEGFCGGSPLLVSARWGSLVSRRPARPRSRPRAVAAAAGADAGTGGRGARSAASSASAADLVGRHGRLTIRNQGPGGARSGAPSLVRGGTDAQFSPASEGVAGSGNTPLECLAVLTGTLGGAERGGVARWPCIPDPHARATQRG
jgi:hypothetical protein